MLSFVGLGLYDEHSITLDGQDTIQAADYVVTEAYTSRLTGTSLDTLESFHNVTITELNRAAVEQDPDPLLDQAETEHVVFLTGGDPMISTTHVDLRLRAHDRDITTQIIHGTTAQTAASSLTGLQNYRFGKATTLPFPRALANQPVPQSVRDTIATNQDMDLHTLIYLDIDGEHSAYLSGTTASKALATHYPDTVGIVVARAGSSDPLVEANRLTSLATQDYGPPLHLIVIPASLHPMEAAALTAFANAPPDLV